MYFKLYFVALVFSLIAFGVYGQEHTVKGNITDKTNGEKLIGAHIFIEEIDKGNVSNSYGFYSISLPEGKYHIKYSFVGYKPKQKVLSLTSDTTLNIELIPADQVLEEVDVTAEKKDANVTANQMSSEKLEVKKIRKLPTFMGEVDIIKSIQLLPGVHSTSEGSSGYSVRGGSIDQNLILLDEATVYNASHLLGFFSVFNNDAIRNVELYKGDIPAKYGGRLSSVLDVRMKEGNNKDFTAKGGIGNISSRLTLEGPIGDTETSYILSGRRTYFDLFIPLIPNDEIQGNKLYFYDFNAKINHRLNENNRFFLSGYFGRDLFKNDFADFGFGNNTATFRWNHLFSDKLFSNLTVLYSRYDYHLGTEGDSPIGYLWKSDLKDYKVKMDFNYYLNPSNTIKFGLSSTLHQFNPGTIEGKGAGNPINTYKVPGSQALEHQAYISNQTETGRFTFKYGLHFSAFQNMGESLVFDYDENYDVSDSTQYEAGEIYNTYFGLSPRLGIKFMLTDASSLKWSYSRTRQYMQLARNSSAGTPLDIWFPSSPNVKPQIADQIALGYFRNFADNKIETSIEAYYKKMYNTIDFKDHANLLLNKYLEGELRFGNSFSYGAEFMLKFKYPKLNGWLSYTYTHTMREINTINDGEPYPAPYNKPHDLSIVLSYDITKRLTASSTWVYATGTPVTFPTGRYEYNGVIAPVYSEKNGYRMPDYHRLDLSVTLQGKKRPDKKWHSEWNFSVYNAYNRKNAWAINFKQDEENPKETYAEKTYLFSIIPAITYNFTF